MPENQVASHEQLDDEQLAAHIYKVQNDIQNFEYQLGLAKEFLGPLQDEQRLRKIVGGFEILKEFRKKEAAKLKRLAKKAPRTFFLNEAHTTHISKSDLRKERAEYKKSHPNPRKKK